MRETTPNRNIRMNYQSMSDAVTHSSLNNIKKKKEKKGVEYYLLVKQGKCEEHYQFPTALTFLFQFIVS